MVRKASLERVTKETEINVNINIDGKNDYKINSGIGFLDHMLEQLSKHSFIDIDLMLRVIYILIIIILLKIQVMLLAKQ